MKKLNLDTLKHLGEYDEKYGQTYWGTSQEQLQPVMFNSMERGLSAPLTIEAEEVLVKESKKGTEYHRLKKVKVVEDNITEQMKAAAAPTLSLAQGVKDSLDRIEAKLDKLLGNDENLLGGEPVDLEEVPFDE